MHDVQPTVRAKARSKRPRRHAAAAPNLSLAMADAAGLIDQPKTKHVNAKVQPDLFAAAARRVGTQSPAAVIEAGLAALATQDDLGPWLARQWGSLADVDPELLAQIDL
jgi:hypothetical protein